MQVVWQRGGGAFGEAAWRYFEGILCLTKGAGWIFREGREKQKKKKNGEILESLRAE